MKKIVKITGIVLVLLLVALVAAPFLFKDKIKAFVEEQVDSTLDAKVYFGDVGLSFIRNFPNARISVSDFGVVGKGEFGRDTLAQGKQLGLVIDLLSLFGDEIVLKKAMIDQARIQAIVLESGKANWDIVKPDTTATETPESSSSFKASLQAYEITDSYIYYEDATFPTAVTLTHVNHSGSGDFTASNYDLRTQTTSPSMTVVYDGVTYFNQAEIDAAVNMNIDNGQDMIIKLLDNLARINALEVAVNGTVIMKTDSYGLDLSFASQNNQFSSLLSMVPGVYTQDFQDIKTEGNLNFNGFIKGTYSEQQMPGFGINLKVGNAMFQYPGLPKAVTGIQADMSISNPDGNLENTLVDIRSFHADLGQNPINAKMTIRGLDRIFLNGKFDAKLNLEELTSMFPIEDTELKGLFSIDANASGVYDADLESFPKVNATMSLTDGYAKNAEYPAELTAINMAATLSDPDGKMENGVFDISPFSFSLDGEPVSGKLHVTNFANPEYDLQANGTLDLEKLMKIYPIDSMSVSGKIFVDQFATSGKMSDIEAERYDQLPTSGKVRVQDIRYSSPDLAQPVVVTSGTASFSPARIDIANASGKLGSSDFQADGYFSNYLAYALVEDEPLTGSMNFRSRKMNLNEWMVEETGTTEAGSEEPLSVIPIPANLDVSFRAQLDEVIYDDLNLKNISGNIVVADEQAALDDVHFGLLGGVIAMSGAYNTQNQRMPHYNFFIDVKELAIKEAYKYFNAVQAFTPIAKFIDGICNTTLGIDGNLYQDMTPVLESINSEGVIEVPNGKLSNFDLLNTVASRTKLNSLKTVDLQKVQAAFGIENGAFTVKPFDIKHDDMVMTLSGRHSISGDMNYSLDLDIPSGKVGDAAFQALSQLSGGGIKTSDRVQMTLKLGGSLTNPSISGLASNTSDQVKDQAISTVESKLQEKTGLDLKLGKDSTGKDVVERTTDQAKDTLKAVVEETKQQVKDTVTAVVETVKDSVATRVEEEIGDRLGEETKETLKNLKDKFGFPKKKKK